MSIRNYYITLVSVALGGLVFSTLLYFEFQKRVHDRTFAHLETVLTCKIHSIEVLKDSMGLSKKEINQLFTDRHLWEKAGMGKTGESILVDSFYRLENDPRFPERASYLITSDAIERALSGKSGRGIMRDYGNVKVFAVYSSIEIHGETHAVVSKIDFWEIYISFLPTRSLFVLLCAMSLFGFGAFYKLIRQHQKTVRVKESVIHTDGESIVSLRRQDGPVVIKLSAPHHIGDRYIIGVVEDATEKDQWREIVTFFIDGKLKEAVELILEIEPDDDRKSEWIMLENQLTELDRKKKTGTIPDEEYTLERNRIKKAIADSIKF